MSTVCDVLNAAINERRERSLLIRVDINSALERLQSYYEASEQCNKELKELLDSLECEIEHLERVNA